MTTRREKLKPHYGSIFKDIQKILINMIKQGQIVYKSLVAINNNL